MLKATPAPSSGSSGPCYLKTKQVVNGANDDVDGCGAAGLSPQIVLEVWRKEITAVRCFILSDVIDTFLLCQHNNN